MRLWISMFCTAFNFGLTGPAHASADAALVDLTLANSAYALIATTPGEETCNLHIFHANHHPPLPQLVRQITCLDQMCHQREVLICTSMN